MMILKKKKENQSFKNNIMYCLELFWKKNYNPTPKDLKTFLRINNLDLLKKTLRHLRIAKYLDGAYDEKNTFRIYPYRVTCSDILKNSIPSSEHLENIRKNW